MVVAFEKILEALLFSVFTGRKIYIFKICQHLYAMVFLSVSPYLIPFNSQAATNLTMFLLTLKGQMYFSTG